jgi:miniconductance mechanosensitive channel
MITEKDFFEFATRYIYSWLAESGVSERASKVIADYSGFIILIVLSILVFILTRYLTERYIHRLAARSSSTWDDALVKRRFFKRLAYLVPAIFIHKGSEFVIPDYPAVLAIVQLVVKVYIYSVLLLAVLAGLNAFHDWYTSLDKYKDRPVKGFIQVIKVVFISIFVIILITLIFVGRKDFGWLAGLGAFSAVLLLVFKDPILGFVGGITLTINDMLRIGDWIEMPKYGADGNVIEVTITTVKVQNFDKTITTIPTYALVSDSYKNWRGMEESGGRRIKRAVLIDMNSIRFCTHEMLERFQQFEYVADYVRETEMEVQQYNEEHRVDNTRLLNGRRQTNIGVFRAYLLGYLRNNPAIRQDMSFMVRHLPPSENGLPVEIYVFTNEQEWVKYETVIADIFDHVLAAVSHFDLAIFQNPSGSDFGKLAVK